MSSTVHDDIRQQRGTQWNLRGTLAASLAVGLGGELVVPWTILGLSNWLFFDVPRWAMWLLFATPIALAALTPLAARLVRATVVVARGRTGRALDQAGPPP